MTQMTVHDALLADIERTGYYPALVAEALDAAIAAEPIVGFFVHHEPTFEHDEIRRHMTCLVLTPSRFLLSHTDEHPADEIVSTPYASTSVETVVTAAREQRDGDPRRGRSRRLPPRRPDP